MDREDVEEESTGWSLKLRWTLRLPLKPFQLQAEKAVWDCPQPRSPSVVSARKPGREGSKGPRCSGGGEGSSAEEEQPGRGPRTPRAAGSLAARPRSALAWRWQMLALRP